ncbi:cytochrome [Moniliophthora roreri MCA 2997]|uniref:Tpa: cytochrome n=1 Tax=Moniliophthora roreri (strain MCA 2997) TaxID=1381753 RepID=V2Y6C1_MONRO|nr:cytochrome [Moniliophthora roreri MCA 2997]
MQLFKVYILLTPAIFGLIVWRALCLDPLGLILARWTWLYQAYYDIVVSSSWLSHLSTLHKKVGCNELHFTDLAAYTDIYNSPYKMPKDPVLYTKAFQFGLPPDSFLHILRLVHVIQEHIIKFISQLVKNYKAPPANMSHAFHSVTLDIITLYTLQKNLNVTSFPSFHLQSPVLTNLFSELPYWLAVHMNPGVKAMIEMNTQVKELVDRALQDSDNNTSSNMGDLDNDNSNMFYTLIRNAHIKGKLRQSSRVTRDWLIAEGVGLWLAGSDTVRNTCTIGTCYLIREDRVCIKLVQELETAWPDKGNPIPLEHLEKLPYLTAVIKETLCLSFGIVTPMTRVIPNSGAVISGYPVPPGTIVSIGNFFVHMNPEIFCDPACFYPE